MKNKIKILGFILLVLIVGLKVFFKDIITVGKGSIPVITYHSISDVNPQNNEYILETKKFEEMIEGLSKNGFTFLSLVDLENIINGNETLPKNPILVAFDDGYEDNYTTAFPILKKYNAKAAIFIIGSYVEKDGFLTWDQIQEMAESGYISFGNHSYNLHDQFLDGPNKGKTWMSAKLEDETDEEYYEKIKNDLIWNNALIYQRSSVFPTAIAYPGAMVNDAILNATKDAGITIGFIGGNKTASKLKNLDPYKIHRFHIKKSTDIQNMIRFLKSNN